MTRLLIVDDNKQNLYMLQVLLEGHGYEVVLAANGAEALEKARRDPPDMIISDILMPVMDGFTLCREWKKDEQLKHIPFVFYTATYTDPKDEEFALILGAERFIVKPVEPDVFVGMLREVIREAEEGRLVAPREPVEEEAVYFKQYNEALIRKLEDKMLQLEEANRALKREITERVRAEERIEHLNLVLRAIRGVNQLIIREKDCDRLLQGTCDNLIETRGYHNAWIALLDEAEGLVTSAEAGLGEDFSALVERLQRGEWFYCARKALAQPGALAIEDPLSTCADCPLADKYRGRGAMTVRMEHGRKVYGLLSASIPAHLAADEEEQAVLKEVAEDIAFALHSIELEEERERAEEALRESEERFRQFFENQPTYCYMVSPEGVVLDVNNAALRALGYEKEELVGKHLKTVYAPESLPRTEQLFAKWRETGELRDEEMVIITKEGGDRRTVLLGAGVVKDKDGKVLRSVSVQRDITERKRAEEEIRKLNQYLGSIIDNANVWLDVLDEKANVVIWNKAAEEISGYSREEVVGHGKVWEWLYPDEEYRSGITAEAAAIIEKGEVVEDFETTIRRKDGRTRIISWNSRNLLDEKGNPIGSIALGRDITERKRAEEELRRLKEFNEGIVQGMVEGIAVEDAEGYLTFVNPAGAAMLGYAPEELLGRHWMVIIPPDQQPIVQAADERRARGESDHYELQCIREDGTRVPVLISGSPRFEEGRFAGTLAVFTDITDRKRAEEALQHTLERLREALGGIIQTVALTVEMRDPYTAGHQRRVSNLARAIATEMGTFVLDTVLDGTVQGEVQGLSEDQIEGIRMAGVIHDLGKINVPAEILSWPGRLNDFQFGLIKMHSQIGYDILKTVEFPWPVAQIVLQHHERLDGSGYPQGLSGDEIMLEARILAVADVVEAMASRRPYRPPRGLDKALEEISQNRGVLYDPEVVDVCLRLFTEKGFAFE